LFNFFFKKKIIKWDTNTGKIVQEYDQHLGAVNTITFIDNNRRFVSTSDDKSIRVWEWNIPVVIKYIAEPHMHSMPAVTMHPSRVIHFLDFILFHFILFEPNFIVHTLNLYLFIYFQNRKMDWMSIIR